MDQAVRRPARGAPPAIPFFLSPRFRALGHLKSYLRVRARIPPGLHGCHAGAARRFRDLSLPPSLTPSLTLPLPPSLPAPLLPILPPSPTLSLPPSPTPSLPPSIHPSIHRAIHLPHPTQQTQHHANPVCTRLTQGVCPAGAASDGRVQLRRLRNRLRRLAQRPQHRPEAGWFLPGELARDPGPLLPLLQELSHVSEHATP